MSILKVAFVLAVRIATIVIFTIFLTAFVVAVFRFLRGEIEGNFYDLIEILLSKMSWTDYVILIVVMSLLGGLIKIIAELVTKFYKSRHNELKKPPNS